jgi:hypothetical protein
VSTVLVRIALSGRALLQSISDPDFDEGLAGHSQSLGFLVQGLDHPNGEIDIHPLLGVKGTTGLGQIEKLGDVLSRIETLVKLSGLHEPLLPLR